MRAMNAFEGPFWNLDQLLAWMISRAPEAVQFASIDNVSRDTKTSRLIRRFAELAALRAAKNGRNIEEELWAASGLDPESYQKTRSFYSPSPKERALRGFCEKRPLETELFMEEALTRIGRARLMIRGLDRVEPERLRSLLKDVFADNAVQEPPREVVVSLFPYRDYLLRLFRKGALVASGNLPGKRALEISLAEWAGLEIAEGDNTHRLGIWRVGRPANAKRGIDRLLGREDLHPGTGDIENVRIQRDEILKEFPEKKPRAQNLQEVKPLSEAAARQLIEDVANQNGGYITLEKGGTILRTRDPSMKRDFARDIVKSVIANEKRGPRGPRNNSAK
jgi:hypothetical protein